MFWGSPNLNFDDDDDDEVQKNFGASAVGRSYSALAIRKTTKRPKINCPGPRVSWKFFLPHFWGSKGAFDAILDALGTPLERFWNHLGRSWDALGAILGALGRVLGALGTLLGALRAILGCPWAKRSVPSLFGRPSWEVKWDLKSLKIAIQNHHKFRDVFQRIFHYFSLIFCFKF